MPGRATKYASPEGTADSEIRSAVPSRLVQETPFPGVKTPGYFRKSLRDFSVDRLGLKGCTRILPRILRERSFAKAAAVWSSGKIESITGFNFPAAAHSSVVSRS